MAVPTLWQEIAVVELFVVLCTNDNTFSSIGEQHVRNAEFVPKQDKRWCKNY